MANFIPYAKRLQELSRIQPEQPALTTIDSGGYRVVTTYAELQRLVETYSANLREIKGNDELAVAVLLPNDLCNVTAAAAAWAIGAFVVPLNPNAPAAELATQIELIRSRGTRVVVVMDRTGCEGRIDVQGVSAEATNDQSGRAPVETIDVAALAEPRSNTREPAELHTPSRAICSGGTTGRPKLIVDETPWGWSRAEPLLDRVGWSEATGVLIYSPLYYNVGATLTHRALMAGKSAVLLAKFSAALAVEVVREAAIDFFFAVPTHMQRILALEGIRREDFSSIRSMYHSGAQCPPSLKRQWLALLGPERVWEVYGATDGCGFTVIRGDDWLQHPGSVGKPVESEIKILDSHDLEVPVGSIGTIAMAPAGSSAHSLLFSYIGADMPPLIGGRYRTAGDMGWFDEQGYLYIADRRTDMIVSGGANIFPAEIESALIEHDAVEEAAVIGLPDVQWGHRVHAIIKPINASFTDWRQLDQHCRKRIASYKVPKSYEFVDLLPRTEVGKVSRTRLISDRTQSQSTRAIP